MILASMNGWTIVGLCVIALVILCAYLYRTKVVPGRKRREAERIERDKADRVHRFGTELYLMDMRFNYVESKWKEEERDIQEKVVEEFHRKLQNKDFNPRHLLEACQGSSINFFPVALRETLARKCIKSWPADRRAYDLAKYVWGPGSVPDDIVTLLIENDNDVADILKHEINVNNRKAMAALIAAKGNIRLLETMFPYGVPETHAMACLNTLLEERVQYCEVTDEREEDDTDDEEEENEEEDDDDEDDDEERKTTNASIVRSLACLKDWNGIVAMVENEPLDQEDVLDVMKEAPEETIASVAEWIVQSGHLDNLIALYELSPIEGGKPPYHHLKECLRVNTARMHEDMWFEHNAVRCCLLLEDAESGKAILPHLQCTENMVKILRQLYLHEHPAAVPATA